MMPDTESTTLRDLLNEPDPDEALGTFIVDHSRLPGPRANLGLAKRFADQVASQGAGADDERWDQLRGWVAIDAADAPTGDPREFLPFCAVQALGALYASADEARRTEIETIIRQAASDERWRVREGAAIALQRIGLRDFTALQAIIDGWLPEATLLGQRAILAALAEPPLLRAPGAPAYALAVADLLLETVRGLEATRRRGEPFRVLRQALEYGLSVMVAASPEDGFSHMRAWAAINDRDIQRILRANLGKARLAAKFGDEVRRVEESRSRGVEKKSASRQVGKSM